MATSDWLDLRGWIGSLVGWSMDNVHDILPSEDLDLQVTISLFFQFNSSFLSFASSNFSVSVQFEFFNAMFLFQFCR